MPHVKRCATAFLMLMASAIVVLVTVMILLMTRPAWSAEQIPCWKAKAFIAYAGSTAEAEKLAEKHGYTRAQIAEVRRRCAL